MNLKAIYISETMQTCDFVKRFILSIKRIFNIVKIDNIKGKTIFYLPIYQNNRLSKYRIKKISKKIINLLKKEGISDIVLSNYLETVDLLKNNLYSNNLNILDGRYLFKCLSYKVIEYIFKLKKKTMKLRRSFIVN